MLVGALLDGMRAVFEIQESDHALLACERERLLGLVRAAVPYADVLEVGSTAIPGVVGKGDIDLLARCDAVDFERMTTALDRVLVWNPDQLCTPEYRGYTCPSPLDLAVQATVRGGPYDDFEPFLDALRADATLVDAYNELKRRFDGQPMDVYREAKAAFIRAVLDQAGTESA